MRKLFGENCISAGLRDLGAEGRTIKERFGNENTQLQDWHEEKLQSHESGLENVFEVKPESHMDQVTRWITNLARPTSRRAERRMNNHEKSGGEDCAAIHQHSASMNIRRTPGR